MAVLTEPQRAAAMAELMREISSSGTVTITKAALRAALNAADVWADSNASSYNTAIPQPARNALTSRQKAHILALVIMARWKVSI